MELDPRAATLGLRGGRSDVAATVDAGGEAGLVPKYPRQTKRRVPTMTIELIRVARTEHQWGAPRTRVWLERVHRLRVNARTIQRVFRASGFQS
jgi:hypothetical protein